MVNEKEHPPHLRRLPLFIGISILFVISILAVGLTLVTAICPDCDGQTYQFDFSFQVWLSFLIVLLIGAGILFGGWWVVQASEKAIPSSSERPRPRLPVWLFALVVGAALLRLVLGVVWYLAVPQLGHGTPQEMDGYIAADAYERDQLAWKLSQSPKNFIETIESGRRVDPYGGMLFISTGIYRILSSLAPGNLVHPPLIVVVITAAFSALAVLFTFAFSRLSWDDEVARFAAWGIALYPEAVLLGSSQMREAFIIPLVAAAFYGLVYMRKYHAWIGLVWLLAGVLLTFFFSPPIAMLLIISLVVVGAAIHSQRSEAISSHPSRRKLPRWGWVLLAGVLLLALVGGWLALRQFAPENITSPVDVVSYWLRKSVDLQAYYSKNASGWLQKIFRTTPEWTHLPILTFYGILRPFLPAALMVSSEAPIWSWITLWRALGWTILLGLLVYAILRAWFKKDSGSFTRALTVVIILGILIASLRGGGDQDDNPRYRAAFSSIQIALAAWGLLEQKRTRDPVFRRALITVIFVMAWSLLWYLRRLYPVPGIVADPFKTIGLGLACGVLVSIADWVQSVGKK